MRLAFRISLLAIGLASLFAATASAGSLVEFANLPERRPATLFGYLARPDQGLSVVLGCSNARLTAISGRGRATWL